VYPGFKADWTNIHIYVWLASLSQELHALWSIGLVIVGIP